MSEKETLYEQMVKRLKNKWSVVFIILSFSVVIAVSQFVGGLSKIGNFLFPKRVQMEVLVSIQPYDLMAEATESPKMLEPIKGDVDSIQHIAELCAGQVVEVSHIERSLETRLEISGNLLSASHSLLAYIQVQAPIQQSPLQREFGRDNGLDLVTLFQSPLFFDRSLNCISVFTRDGNGYFQREFFRIFKNEDSFSFSASSKVTQKTIRFSPRKSKIIIDSFSGSGVSPEIIERTKTSLSTSLRKKLETYEFLAISPLTREELLRKRSEIRSLPPGEGKGQLIDQYNVDFIVTGRILMKTTRRFLCF